MKIVGLAALGIWCQLSGKDAQALLSERWDSLWYARVAEHGYDYVLQAPDGRLLSNMAFFPLLPWLEKGFAWATPLNYANAGLAISAVASIAAAWGIFKVASLYSTRVATISVSLWGALPVGIVQSMAYSESLFVALAAWAIYCIVSERWITASLLAALAGLTRPVGLAVALALIVTAVISFTRSSPRAPQRLIFRRIFACLLAPAGASSYILWVGTQRNELLAYLEIQKEWGNGFDFGWAFSRFAARNLSGSVVISIIVLALILALAAWPHVVGMRQLPIPAIWVYSAIITLLAVGASGYFGSKPRLLMPAFPLLFPVAITLARRRPGVVWGSILLLSVASAAYGASWLNGSGPP
ncbi:hypothetical protein [Streptomyces sp. MUM 203J]|uniref:hypothetical protein n=1 Tax=Streptomyces sp. MUM 203J TaxID=2791990 RepID=UPI001F0427A8|nr:hypothetical protein [Streptomyces sp. MUM 203J]